MSTAVRKLGAVIVAKGAALVNKSTKAGKLDGHTVQKETLGKSSKSSIVGLAALVGIATVFGFVIGGVPLATIAFTGTIGLESLYLKSVAKKTIKEVP